MIEIRPFGKIWLLVLLAPYFLACQTPESSITDDPVANQVESEAKAEKSEKELAESSYELTRKKLYKTAKDGAVFEATYDLVLNPDAQPNIASINQQIEQEVHTKLDDFYSSYNLRSDAIPRNDTLLSVSGGIWLWGNTVASAQVYIEDREDAVEEEDEALSIIRVLHLHYHLPTGRRLRAEDIFKEGMAQLWDRWVEQNVDLDSEVWIIDTINEEGVDLPMKEYYQMLYTDGSFIIEKDGSLTISYITKGKDHWNYNFPFNEIKSFYKLKN